MDKTLHIPYALFEDSSQLSEGERNLLAAAMEATQFASAPFSEFRVGCALLLEGGEVILGNNQENIAFPSGLCAERVAFFKAGSEGKAHLIRKVAIRAISNKVKVDQPPTCCGACRQVMVEYEKVAQVSIPVLMQGESGSVLRLEEIKKCLVPFDFDLEF